MTRLILAPLLIAASPAPEPPKPLPSPPEIVAAAPAADWVAISASDLLVLDLAPLNAKPRRVIIQLMPPPFSQGWVGNIRKLAAARWWDGTSINRVQDNYVVQWGDATEKKALPPGLAVIPESEYSVKSRSIRASPFNTFLDASTYTEIGSIGPSLALSQPNGINRRDQYAVFNGFDQGWPFASSLANAWPTHCYAMVGVGRDLPPNTGSGAELYAVIGHAPRHLDRNIALVGRVIEGIEHLSSLPRGTGPLGFYEKAKERVPILSVRIGSEIADLPRFEYLSTESVSFARYADARANRRDAFFIQPAGGADICNIPVPVRRAK
jgi:peptidylprolyl isomerase